MKIKLGLSNSIKVGSIGMSKSGAAADTTRPSCAVTANATTATAAAFTVTVTFSETVTGFDASKITVANGSAGAVAGSGPYTSVITPTATGNVTVAVADGAVTDAAGNTNTVSNTFSILYAATKAWADFSDTSLLFQDSAGTTPVTADGQSIGRAADKSGNANHFLQAGASTLKPTYKVNIQNGLGAGLGDGGDNLKTALFAAELTQPNTLFIIARNPALATETMCDGSGAGKRHAIRDTISKLHWQATSDRTTGTDSTTSTVLYSAIFNGASSVLYKNGVQIDTFNVGADALAGVTLFNDYAGSSGLNGYIMEYLVIPGALAAGARQAVESYLNTKWVVF